MRVNDKGKRLCLMADVMDVEEAGVLDCFVTAGAELQRTQVAPEADAFTFAQIAGHAGVASASRSYASADAEDVLGDLRAVTSTMDENRVSTGSRVLFITPTLKGMLDDLSMANPNRSNRVLERFSRVVEVAQVRFYTAIDLLSGGDDGFSPTAAVTQTATGATITTTDKNGTTTADIANAIRFQAGVATTYKPRQMAAAVAALDGTNAGKTDFPRNASRATWRASRT